MTEIKFYNNYLAASVLLNSRKNMSRYARIKTIVESLSKKNDYELKFPMYFASLKRKFSTQVNKQKLRNAAGKILSDTFMLNDAFHPVIRRFLIFNMII